MSEQQGDGLAFIVGHYKSGSTWLINALSLHPQIRGVGETHAFHLSAAAKDFRSATDELFYETSWGKAGYTSLLRYRLGDLVRPVRFWKPTLAPHERPATRYDLSRKQQEQLRRQLESSTSADDYCRRFFNFLREALKPESYLVEKTPTNIFEVPRIRQVYPRARLMAIVRDGRDVVVSEKFLMAYLKRSKSFRDSVLDWRKAMESHLAYEEEFGLHTFTYRGFLENGPETVRNLLGFLGLRISQEVVNDIVRRSSFEFTTGRKNGQEAKHFYRKGVPGDWVNHFTGDDKKIFKDLAGDMLVKMGFETNGSW